ncbi:uncharacterized protein LOC112342286 [Selaginella moellendorffii]|uniref:uncharacterized protein LOC112342286 n=1 Tax=Selaginella moellendorffii TaxID=88036 RepID=UPI000D1C8D05|nr:uncharacterized protein LOC112342286 [Selaginella moellendorffii]|eukprot:XP_024519628.1 uncharacterized protein LOC112342286 [Selaginella moellendorffii]
MESAGAGNLPEDERSRFFLVEDCDRGICPCYSFSSIQLFLLAAINADPGEIHALIIAALRCSVGEHAIAEIFFCQELDRHLHRVEPGHCRVSSRLASQPDRRHIPIAAPSSNYYNDKPKMVTVLLSQLQDCEEIRQQGYGLLQRPWLIYPPAVVFQPGLERAFCQLKSRFLVFLTMCFSPGSPPHRH